LTSNLFIGLRLFARGRHRGRREPAALEIDHRHEPGFTNLFQREIERLLGRAIVEDDAPLGTLAFPRLLLRLLLRLQNALVLLAPLERHLERELDLLACNACGLVLHAAPHRSLGFCPRCDQALHRRKPDSHARSWAFLIAAMILYIPANLLPVMRTSTLLGGAENNTILSGVVELWTGGAWDLAVIVFTASIAVPLMKMACLSLLLLSSRQGSVRWQRERTRIYRMVEFIGRWSMLDVFVVALLLSLVRFGILAEVHAGPGIVAFCAVVVLTMLASMSFDPRLIWDVRSSKVPRQAAAGGTGA